LFSQLHVILYSRSFNDREKEELKNKSLAGVLEDIEIDKQFYTMAINNLFGRIKACEDVLDGMFQTKK
jgi:hypothetical protein